MIRVNFEILNPWKIVEIRKAIGFKNLLWASGSITKHKHWEIETYTSFDILFGLELNTQWWGYDHAGIKLRIVFLCLEFQIQMYDCRHWDYELDMWEEY